MRSLSELQDGTVTVLLVFALPVLLLLLLGTIEMGMRVYYRAQVRSAATAAVVAAVGTQVHWPIPIPKKWVVIMEVPTPVDGIVINTLHLPNVDWPGDVRGAALETRNLTNSTIKFAKTVLPWTLAPSPVKWVKITASLSPPLVFSRIVRAGQIEESACAIAWIRPDYWEHGWWDKKSQKSLFGIGDQNYRYYRLVPCDLLGAGDSLEAVITAYVQDTGDGSAVQWSKDAFPGQMPKRDSELDSPPPPDDKVDQCTKDRANCKPKSETYTCRTDGTTTYTMEPQPWEPGQHIPTRPELEAEHCPPPPPKEKKEGSP